VSLLLDTHVWIWSQENPDLLGRKARELLKTTPERLVISSIDARR